MSYGVIGDNYIFHAKFFDGEGNTLTVNTPTITIFTFQSNGDRTVFVSDQQMSESNTETGRWVYSYSIPNDYNYQPVLYGLISAVDPADNSILNYETEVTVLSEDSGIGHISVPEPPPPPSYRSHWETSDGNNGDQSAIATVSPTKNARIPTPNGGEGVPFKVGGEDGTNKTTTTSFSATFTSPQATTGFGGDSTIEVKVYDKDSLIDTFTSPALTSDGVHNSASNVISISISQYGVDDAAKLKAKASIDTNVSTLLPNGGFYHVEIIHHTDSVSDGGDSYTYTQSEIFIDTNPNTPTLGSLSFLESTPTIKYLSGIRYYTNGSTWTVVLLNIDNLNSNSIKISHNISVSSTQYQLATFSHSPFGTGSANFSGWTNDDNNLGTSYTRDDWTLNQSNYRFMGEDGSISAYVSDPWNNSATASTTGHSILIDTYGITSTNTSEPFVDEDRRQTSNFNNGNTAGNWNSTQALVDGEGLVQNSKLMKASEASYVDWTSFKPNGSPDYTGFSANANYYRTFVDSGGLNQPNFILVFSGDFVGDAQADLLNNHFEVFIRRIGSSSGDSGTTSNPLLLHGAEYNSTFFDDGATNGQIRLGSSNGNTIQATFGGFSCIGGVYLHIHIMNANVKIDSIDIIFPN